MLSAYVIECDLVVQAAVVGAARCRHELLRLLRLSHCHIRERDLAHGLVASRRLQRELDFHIVSQNEVTKNEGDESGRESSCKTYKLNFLFHLST